MEDIINALLDVVRAQHSAAEGTDEAPFNMDDIVDMAMNLLGRPDEPEEMDAMVGDIQKMVETLAPDIFPPKTFEEMDNSDQVLSAANMIQNAFMRNNSSSSAQTTPSQPEPTQTASSYNSYTEASYEDEEENQDAGDLNDLIYKNFMSMMGLSTPQVEFPFDRSQIVYGKEKSITEQLAEEEEEKERLAREESERNRKLSAWELAQNAIDDDDAAHAKEPYVPKPVEQPSAKSASQMAAEAIRKSEEEDRMKLEIEKQAEAMMAEAKKRGQDPMKFMLHQQEILQYMESNSDELVSFEDYEDLSPEEKLEIEQRMFIQKQLENGVAPEDIDTNLPEEYIPIELRTQVAQAATEETGSVDVASNAPAGTTMGGSSSAADDSVVQGGTFDDDILRAISQQVIGENAAMLEGGDVGDMAAFQEELFANIKRAMAGSGTSVPMEDIGSLLEQATANSKMEGQNREEAAPEATFANSQAAVEEEAEAAPTSLSAIELAMAAQRAAKPEPQEVRPTLSAAELARAAQEEAKKNAPPQKEEAADAEEELDMNFDELDDIFDEKSDSEEEKENSEEALEEKQGKEQAKKEEIVSQKNDLEEEDSEEDDLFDEIDAEEKSSVSTEEEEDEYEYVDPDELVLGEHTQAEIDEAMENLNSLGLQGDVYERAKRMLLLELAGSEAALDAWLFEQENSKKKKKANVSALDEGDIDDLSDFDEDLFEKELEEAIEEDFDMEELEEDSEEESDEIQEPEGFSDSEEESDEMEDQEESSDSEEESDEMEDQEESSDSEEESNELEDQEEFSDGEGSDDERIEEDIEIIEEETIPADSITDSYAEEIIEDAVEESHEVPEEKTEVKEKKTKSHRNVKTKKSVVHKKEKSTDKKQDKKQDKKEESTTSADAEERGYQLSVRKPFVLKNSTSYIDKFTDFITESQENRKLSTGFKKLDSMLRFGLHKGSYFIDAKPQYLKNSFMQQIADRAAESGVDVLYISTELSRYDLMVDTISRLSYEMNGHDSEKAHSVMSIMTGEDGATLESLADELNWFRGRISEHLFILDQEAVDEYLESVEDLSAGAILEELIRSIVVEGAHKPVVFIDNIENILSVEDSEDMKPLMEGIKKLAKELCIPIVMSYGYAQAESEEELSIEEQEYHESLGNMCDVYLELQYADMITEDYVELTEEDIRDMMEDGETILIDVLIHRNRRPMRASCQIQGTLKFNFFEE